MTQEAERKNELVWERRRAIGKSRFILKEAVIFWIAVGILGNLFDFYYLAPGRSAFDGNKVSLLFLFIVYPLTAFAIAWWDWERNERRYKRPPV